MSFQKAYVCVELYICIGRNHRIPATFPSIRAHWIPIRSLTCGIDQQRAEKG